MKYKLFIIILFLTTTSSVFSQVRYDFPSVDKMTYEQYLSKEWKNLIQTSKLAKDKGIDFYYLQVRTGIAYYELRQYAQAIKYFEHAHKQNSEDELIQEYLYFSYLFSGRYDDARYFASGMNPQLKERLLIGSKYPVVRAIYADTKHDINEDYSYIPYGDELVYQKRVTNQSYYNLSLEHWIGKRITLFHGYSNIGITNEISDQNINLPKLYREFVQQNEYYVSIKTYLKKGTSLLGSFHFLHTNYFAPDPNSTTTSTRGRWSLNTGSMLYEYPVNSYAGSLSLTKQFSLFNASLSVSASNLNQNIQIQPGLSLRIYPIGSPLFFISAKGEYIIEKNETAYEFNPILKPGLGISFLKYSWFEPSITFGHLQNFTEFNSFIANSDADPILRRYEALLNLGIFKGKFNLFLKYQYNIKNNIYQINGTDFHKEYVNQSIAGGLKWYFNK